LPLTGARPAVIPTDRRGFQPRLSRWGSGGRQYSPASDFRTLPWGIEDQAAFINRCTIVETAVAPRVLLDRALAVERALGRDRARERRWGPRPIDIDLLSYHDLVLDEPGLCLPHP